MNVNKSIVQIAFSHSCDGLQECKVDFTVTTFLAIEKLKMYINIRLPQTPDDKFYRKELVRSVFDVDKILNGIRGVPFVGAAIEDFSKLADFDPRFPLPPVSYKWGSTSSAGWSDCDVIIMSYGECPSAKNLTT